MSVRRYLGGFRLDLALLAVLVGLAFQVLPAQADIRTSKHNLSATGPGTVKALNEEAVCRFCHVPHNANPATPLWSHGTSGAIYAIYTSNSIQGSIGQPNGSSKLCLSCHDGAFAVGGVGASTSVPSGSFTMANNIDYITGPALIGTNLTDDHPVSLALATGGSADPEIVANPGDARVKYDSAGRVQCMSCHDAHDDTNPKFLVKANVASGYGSQLCVVCHTKTNWINASHRNSAKLYGGTGVQAQACGICHQTHNALIPTRLLASAEEGLCNTCHNGSASISPAIKNVAGEFGKAYRHPLAIAGKHSPAETHATLSDPLSPNRHSECEDCHNPHGAQGGTHTPGSSKIGAVLIGAWGMKPVYGATPWTDPVSWQKVLFTDTTGSDMLEAYLCFKCHKSLAKDFNPNNPSYHAVVGDSKADPAYGGSYLSGWTPGSRMTCTDCHTSDNSAVKGPHGSSYAQNLHPRAGDWAIVSDPIIAFADYIRGGGHGPGVTSDHWTVRGTGGAYDGNGAVRPSDNDLCFKCHNRRVYGHPTDNTYYDNAANTSMTGYRGTYYPIRNLHIRHMRGKACTTCHVVHGSNKPHLLVYGGDDFHLNSRFYVQAAYQNPWPAGGTWNYMTCHGGTYTGC